MISPLKSNVFNSRTYIPLRSHETSMDIPLRSNSYPCIGIIGTSLNMWVWVKIRYPNKWMVNSKLDIHICGFSRSSILTRIHVSKFHRSPRASTFWRWSPTQRLRSCCKPRCCGIAWSKGSECCRRFFSGKVFGVFDQQKPWVLNGLNGFNQGNQCHFKCFNGK